VPILTYSLIALGSYLLGSIPTGYLVARAKGIDIRTTGSGNIGATNVFRILGTGPGIFVLLVDALKGYAACILLCPLVFNWIAAHYFYIVFRNEPMDLQIRFKVIAGVCAILGHNYSCWLNFKGGKGVATSAGVFFALTWPAMCIALVVWIIVFAFTRYVSVASMIGAVTLPIATWFTSLVSEDMENRPSWLLQSVTIAAALMVIIRHRANLQRLRLGTEKRITFKKTGAAP